uniref:Uncharacterized protein n=1 Tax=Branchiostoma floridae TaxID=7739 RepID=C3XXT1_BRAFL|eukprot:XP_002611531.1 hypothetical protein BRAFLDRAFT_63832 [Branchiostoma floridae]
MESVRPKRTAKLPARLLDTDIQVEIQKVAEEITSLQSSLTTTPEGQGRARPVVSPASSLTETPEGQDRSPSTVPLAEEDALEKERTALLEEIRILELAKEVEDLRRRKVQLQFRSTARREFNPPPAEASPSAPTGPGREGQGLAWSIDVESAKDKSVKDRPGLSQDQAVTHDAASPHDVARTIQDLRRDSAAVAEVDRILGAMSLQPAPVLPLPDPGKLSLPDPSVQPVRQNPGLGLPAANPSVPPAQTNSGLSSAPPTEQPAKPSPNPLVAPKPSVQPTDQRAKVDIDQSKELQGLLNVYGVDLQRTSEYDIKDAESSQGFAEKARSIAEEKLCPRYEGVDSRRRQRFAEVLNQLNQPMGDWEELGMGDEDSLVRQTPVGRYYPKTENSEERKLVWALRQSCSTFHNQHVLYANQFFLQFQDPQPGAGFCANRLVVDFDEVLSWLEDIPEDLAPAVGDEGPAYTLQDGGELRHYRSPRCLYPVPGAPYPTMLSTTVPAAFPSSMFDQQDGHLINCPVGELIKLDEDPPNDVQLIELDQKQSDVKTSDQTQELVALFEENGAHTQEHKDEISVQPVKSNLQLLEELLGGCEVCPSNVDDVVEGIKVEKDINQIHNSDGGKASCRQIHVDPEF